MSHASYLKAIFNSKRRDEAIQLAKDTFETEGVEFDTIVCTGVSGTFGAILATALNKNLCIVRKGGSHSCHKLEYSNKIGRWIFVDDLIDSGATLRRVIRQVERENVDGADSKPTMIGAYLYDEDSYLPVYCEEFRGYLPRTWLKSGKLLDIK